LDAIGAAQDITRRYPGITNHIHMGVRLKTDAAALRGRGFSLRDETWIDPSLLMDFL